jgi:N-acetylglucosamine-6-sulfatase
VAALLVAALLAVGPAPAPASPNVVMIVTDDQTLRDMEVLPRVRAAIGAQGVTFTDHRASYPLCCPARASLLTGQYAHNHRVLGNFPPHGGYPRLDKRHTLPVALQQAGYVTAHIGKYLNGYEYKPFRDVPPGWSNWHGSLRTYRMYGFVLNDNGKENKYGELRKESKRLYQTNVYRRIATRFIRGRKGRDRPFYLSVAFLAPHAEVYDRQGIPAPSVRADPDDVGRLAGKPLPRGASFGEADMSDKPGWLRKELGGPQHVLTPFQIANITRRYRERQEALLGVDRAVAAIVNTLRDTGQLRGTYVIFTSDNGFMEGQHRIKSGKTVAYEPATQLPLLMRGPGIPAGRISREPVIDVDLAPTILDMADARHQGWTIDGRSMLPFAQNPGRARTSRPRLQEIGPQENTRDLDQDGRRVPPDELLKTPRYGGVSTTRYRYVRYRNGQEELYDLERDPEQLQNRISDRRYRRTRRVLRRQLRRLATCAGPGCRKRIGAIPGQTR